MRTVGSSMLLMAALLPNVARAQSGLPGTNISITVRVRSVVVAGDTTTVTTSILTNPTSLEGFFSFLIASSAPHRQVTVPAPYWITDTTFDGIDGAFWVSGPPIARGDSTPALIFRATGIPGIAAAYVRGDSDPVTPDSVYVPAYDPVQNLSAKILSIGIDVAPSGAVALAARLQRLSDSVCTLGAITSPSLCSTLHGLSATADFAAITHFSASLDSARNAGSAVSDAGYWLLKPNASYVLAHITPPPLSAYITVDTATSIYTARPSGGVPAYSYYWEWCAIDCGGGALRAAAGTPAAIVRPNTVVHGWQSVGSTTASICWTMSQSTLRVTVTDAKSTQVVAYYTVPVLQHVCGP